MIIFDEYRYVTDIMRHGIQENDSRVNQKLFLVAKYLLQETTYKPSVIIKNLKKYSKDYFEGLSEEIVDKEIERIYNSAKNVTNIEIEKAGTNDVENDVDSIDFVEAVKYFEPKKLTLYESEMKRIAELDKNLQELAFAFLVVNKFQGYKWTYECNADIYKVCHWDEKGKGKSQTTKDKLIHKLVENEIVSFYCNVNRAYHYNKSWIAKTSFTVPINEDNFDAEKEHSAIWKMITNYDDVMLYWRLYKGDNNVKLCEKCNAPIENTGNSRKFCGDCALKQIRESKKRSKEKSLKIAG